MQKEKKEILQIKIQLLRMSASVVAVMVRGTDAGNKKEKHVKKLVEAYRETIGKIIKDEYRDIFEDSITAAMKINGM